MYWSLTAKTLPNMIKGVQTAFGTDFHLTAVEGVLETAYFPLALNGNKQTFQLGDDSGSTAYHAYMMFQAQLTDNKALANMRKENIGQGSLTDIFYWVYDTENAEGENERLPTDFSFSAGTATMRTGWGPADTVALLHEGHNLILANYAKGHSRCEAGQGEE